MTCIKIDLPHGIFKSILVGIADDVSRPATSIDGHAGNAFLQVVEYNSYGVFATLQKKGHNGNVQALKHTDVYFIMDLSKHTQNSSKKL